MEACHNPAISWPSQQLSTATKRLEIAQLSALGLGVEAGFTLVIPATAAISRSWTGFGNAGKAATHPAATALWPSLQYWQLRQQYHDMKTTRSLIWKLLCTAYCVLHTAGPCAAAIDLGAVQASTIGHSFVQPFPRIAPSVIDYLVDQSQQFGGGGVLSSVSANFDNHTQFVLTISAPAGYKFLVHVTPGQNHASFEGMLGWTRNPGGPGGTELIGTIAATFGGLEGVAPDFSASKSILASDESTFTFDYIHSVSGVIESR